MSDKFGSERMLIVAIGHKQIAQTLASPDGTIGDMSRHEIS